MTEVPVMSFDRSIYSARVPVAGFAQLWIATGSWNSDNGIITATLVSGVASNNVPDVASNVPNMASANYGTYTPVLIR
jgi:hypothetical protein